MGQSVSRRSTAPPATMSTSTSVSEHANDINTPRRSLPRRILSSLPKPSLRSRAPSSLTLPTRPEQTLRGKKRRWGLSRRRNVSASVEGAVSELPALVEHDEHPVDRDVDEFGVITHRVPDSHSDSQAPSAKGKERAKEVSDVEDGNEDDNTPIPSSSAASPRSISSPSADPIGDDQVIVSPTVLPSFPPPPSLPIRDPERPLDPTPSAPTSLPMSQSLPHPTNSGSRPFPPPGTLVVVQGVVHTTDVPRSSDRPAVTSNPTPSTANDALNPNANTGVEATSTRPTSLPAGTRSRNPLSAIFPRPTSMVSAVPSPLPLDSTVDSAIDSQIRQATSSANVPVEQSENEDRPQVHPHGISMAQGPIGASGLSASSIDVLGTLLSVAAAATAASLLTGSSEPIFSSGLTPSQPPPFSDTIPQTTPFNPNVPSERPLSPTPTSDAGRMRHVWSSLRDRLGLGSGAHNSNHPHDTTFNSVPGQSAPSQTADGGRPRDPREIMLAEMARAFNLGLGLGGAAGAPPTGATASPHLAEAGIGILDNNEILGGDRNGEQPLLPPPDSFERFLMDLQTDLRVTLMQEQDSDIFSGPPQDTHRTATGDVEEDQHLPELQSLSDSDSDEFEAGDFDSGDEDGPDCERDADEDMVEEDVHTAQEGPSGRTSPAVSALGTGIRSPFGIRTRHESTSSFPAIGTSALQAAPLQAMNTTGDREGQNVLAPHTSPSAVGMGTLIPISDSSPSEMRFEEGPVGAVSDVAHSIGASNGAEAEGARALTGAIAVLPHHAQDASNALGTGTQEPLLSGTSLSVPLMSSTPNLPQAETTITTQAATQPSTWTLPLSSGPDRTIRNTSSTNPASVDSSMPFHLPFSSSSASRTERTPGGGINWWRMYRFPAVTSPSLAQPGGPQGSLPLSQPSFRSPVDGPSHTSNSSWTRTADQNRQNEILLPRGVTEVPDVHSGLAAPALTPPATSTNMPALVSIPTETPPHTNGQDSNSSSETPEHRSNVVVPVIVVGLQSVNMDRQLPHMPHPHANHATAADDEDGDGMDFDGLEQAMSMPLHVPEPAEFRHHPSATQQEQRSQQPARGRTWHSRAASAFRNLRPSRRNADTTSPPPQETPGSRTFLIYVIGGYYPPDHQIITGGNLDSFEALWELAELLGQVKPQTATREEIERSGLEIIKASMLAEYEKQGRVASNCIDKCLICLDEYDAEEELRVLTCKHAFHLGCVDRWLETGRNNCPACRTKGVASQDA